MGDEGKVKVGREAKGKGPGPDQTRCRAYANSHSSSSLVIPVLESHVFYSDLQMIPTRNPTFPPLVYVPLSLFIKLPLIR